MQKRLVLVLGLLGALAGLVLILALYLAREPKERPIVVEARPASLPPPPEQERAETQSGTLKGRVVNGNTGEPLPGAKVAALAPHLEPAKSADDIPTWGGLLERKAIVTDAQGEFALTDLPPDYWNLWVEKRGYSWTTVPRAKFDVTHEIKLFPACSVHGKVIYSDGSPAPGVRIEYHVQGTHSEVFSHYKLDSYYDVTKEDGTFLYTDLPPGKFTIEVYPPDHLPAPWRHEPPLRPGENRELMPHKLDDGFGMTVRVLWRETEEPVPGIEVVVRPVGDPEPRTKLGQRRRTGPDGIARFKGLGGQVIPKPMFQITANVNDEPVLPDEGGMFKPGSEVTIFLRKEGLVTGQVVARDGSPLHGFYAELEPLGHFARQLRATGEAGAFKVYRVPSGRYRLHVRHGDLVEHVQEIEVTGGQELDVGVLRLAEGVQIAGTVRRASGRDLGEVVRVFLSRKAKAAGGDVWEEVKRVYCREDGSYVIRGVAPGSYALRPEALAGSGAATEAVQVEVPEGVSAIDRDLTLHADCYLSLRFLDEHQGNVIHVTQPPTYLIEAATGREIRWFGAGTRLRAGKYTVEVELPDESGVPGRYTALEVDVREIEGEGLAPGKPEPIEIRLFEIRDGNQAGRRSDR
jgi:hypothetical protein